MCVWFAATVYHHPTNTRYSVIPRSCHGILKSTDNNSPARLNYDVAKIIVVFHIIHFHENVSRDCLLWLMMIFWGGKFPRWFINMHKFVNLGVVLPFDAFTPLSRFARDCVEHSFRDSGQTPSLHVVVNCPVSQTHHYTSIPRLKFPSAKQSSRAPIQPFL